MTSGTRHAAGRTLSGIFRAFEDALPAGAPMNHELFPLLWSAK